MPYRAVIIGGGPCAILIMNSLLSEYKKQFPKPTDRPRLNILVMDKKGPHIGRGSLYLERLSALDVSQPANQMSLNADDPEHCIRLLSSVGMNVQPESILPRATYGFYAESAFNEIVRTAPLEVATISLPLTVAGISGSLGKFKVILPKLEGQSYEPTIDADQAFLAIGHIHRDPAEYNGACYSLTDTASMKAAWDFVQKILEDKCEKERRNQSVVMVGNGPSAVDCLQSLDQWGYIGNVTIIGQHYANLPQNYQKSGRLTFIDGAAEFSKMTKEGEQTRVQYTASDGSNQLIDTDMVFDGSPWLDDYRQEPLLRQICDTGLGRFDREIGRLLCTRSSESKSCPGLFSVGPQTKTEGDATGIWSIESFRQQARAAAIKFVGHMAATYLDPMYARRRPQSNAAPT